MGIRHFLLASVLLLGVGCPAPQTEKDGGADLSAVTADMAACVPQPDFKSDCGKPCDKGNSLGVGKFCSSALGRECQDNKGATLCSQLGSQDTFFCTFICQKNGPANQCGEGAECTCSGGSCGCTPSLCLGPAPDGGASDGGAGDAGTGDGGPKDAGP